MVGTEQVPASLTPLLTEFLINLPIKSIMEIPVVLEMKPI
jgi:hypothetical protein